MKLYRLQLTPQTNYVEQEWRQVHGFEYLISREGLVRAMDRVVPMKNGRTKTEKEMFLSVRVLGGYKTVVLCKNSRKYTKKVHRLIAQAFILNPNNYPQINHKNGIKIDNRLCNIEWTTRSENIKHAWKTGLITFTENRKSNNLKAIEATRRKVEKLTLTGDIVTVYASITEAANDSGVDVSSIWGCINGRQKTSSNHNGYMPKYRLQLTPETQVRTTQGDSVLFRIPSECQHTLKEGNTITVKGSKGKPDYKAVVVLIGDVKTKVSVKGRGYSVASDRIVACDGINCKHKLSEAGRRRLKRIVRYNDYKENILTEAKRIGFDLPFQGASIYFFIPMPVRWNKTIKLKMHGQIHRSRPDLSNLLKAMEDGLLKEDSFIGHYSGLGKYWVDSPSGWIDVIIDNEVYNPFGVDFIYNSNKPYEEAL